MQVLPAVYFGKMACVACCRSGADPRPLILINRILNHSSVPREVIRSILIHEFLHIVVPGREIDGKSVSHPPEFWEKENELNPLIRRLWDWLYLNFPLDLIRDKKREGTYFTRRGLRRMSVPYSSMEDVEEFWSERSEAQRENENPALYGL